MPAGADRATDEQAEHRAHEPADDTANRVRSGDADVTMRCKLIRRRRKRGKRRVSPKKTGAEPWPHKPRRRKHLKDEHQQQGKRERAAEIDRESRPWKASRRSWESLVDSVAGQSTEEATDKNSQDDAGLQPGPP